MKLSAFLAAAMLVLVVLSFVLTAFLKLKLPDRHGSPRQFHGWRFGGLTLLSSFWYLDGRRFTLATWHNPRHLCWLWFAEFYLTSDRRCGVSRWMVGGQPKVTLSAWRLTFVICWQPEGWYSSASERRVYQMLGLRSLALWIALAVALATPLAIPTEVFAQAFATAGDVAIVATPATQEAVQDQAWWAGLADQAITALAGLLSLAVASLAPFLYQFIRNKSKLAALVISQGMLDKMVAAIQNQIRVEADELRHKLGIDPITPALKAQIAHQAQPKIEAAFKETLASFGKKPGTQAVTDMILGRVDQALAKPEPVKIPAVMARS